MIPIGLIFHFCWGVRLTKFLGCQNYSNILGLHSCNRHSQTGREGPGAFPNFLMQAFLYLFPVEYGPCLTIHQFCRQLQGPVLQETCRSAKLDRIFKLPQGNAEKLTKRANLTRMSKVRRIGQFLVSRVSAAEVSLLTNSAASCFSKTSRYPSN